MRLMTAATTARPTQPTAGTSSEKRALGVPYSPQPYHQDSEDTTTCPDCGRGDAADANFCDQCDARLTPTEPYTQTDVESIECPECQKGNDDDAHFCDQCGVKLEGRTDVQTMTGAAVTDEEQPDETNSDSMHPLEGAGQDAPGTPIPPSDDGDFGVGGASADIGSSANGISSSYSSKTAPRSNLVRDYLLKQELRAVGDAGLPQLVVRFCAYGVPYEISSIWEGDFIEIWAPGSLAQTINEDMAAMRCLYDHGFDPYLGNKPVGAIRSITDTPAGPEALVSFYNTDFNRGQLIPLIQGETIDGEMLGSALGSSMRFESIQESWNFSPPTTDWNPRQLPIRTILQGRVLEFGPVTFPANPGATSFARSVTDEWHQRVADETETMFAKTLKERLGARSVEALRASVPRDVLAALEARKNAKRVEVLQRRAKALLITSAA